MKKIFIEETITRIGEEVELYGWAETIRDHKKVVFVDLRDSTGIVQIVGGPQLSEISSEDVVRVTGVIKSRPDNLINDKIPTGKIEIELKDFTIISKSNSLPLPIDTDGYEVDEEVRHNYRYLDLRRKRMLKNLRTRSEVITFMRDFLTKRRFIEIETPILTKTSPEGARDFIVPSRLQRGKFLMVAGIERYFQIARCFRDEDPRADRAYGEFTQLDIEMSFVTQEDILELTEQLFTELIKKVFPHKKIKESPWPRISHKETIEKYKSDRPDLRKNKEDKDELAFAWIVDFPLFTEQSQEDFYHGMGKSKYAPSHHMFTAPRQEDIPLLDKDPGKVRGLQHDLVLNGFEVGGGSIRIHDPKIQEKVFTLIGFTQEQKDRFSDLLEAFTYGVPPHGGIAPGLDRFLMVILGEPSIREIVAFPASSSGKTAVMHAPSTVEKEQLEELGINIHEGK